MGLAQAAHDQWQVPATAFWPVRISRVMFHWSRCNWAGLGRAWRADCPERSLPVGPEVQPLVRSVVKSASHKMEGEEGVQETKSHCVALAQCVHLCEPLCLHSCRVTVTVLLRDPKATLSFGDSLGLRSQKGHYIHTYSLLQGTDTD